MVYLFLKDFINISNENILHSLVAFFGILIFIGAGYVYRDYIADEAALLKSKCSNHITEIKQYFTLAYSTIFPFLLIFFGVSSGIYYFIHDYFPSSSHRNSYNLSSNSNYIESESSSLYQEDDESTESTDIADMSCSEILTTVMDNGDLLYDLDDSDMNSSALDYIALYEYEGLYYLIVEFTSSGKKYVYCDINYSDWNDFVDNDEKSYGTSFNRHLGYSNCNCD